MDSQEILERLRKDLLKFRLSHEYSSFDNYELDFALKQVGKVEWGFILPTMNDYEKLFNKSQKTISRIINNNFSGEEKEYRKKAVNETLSERTKNNWKTMPKQERKKRGEGFGKSVKIWGKRSKNSEKVAKSAFESLGWKVTKLFKFESEILVKNRTLRKIILTKKKLLKEKVHCSMKLDTEWISSFLEGISEKEKIVSCLQELNLMGKKLPDFILRKDNSFMFVEVKNHRKKRKCTQAFAIKKFKEEGWKAVVYNLILNEKMDKKEFKKEVSEFVKLIQEFPQGNLSVP